MVHNVKTSLREKIPFQPSLLLAGLCLLFWCSASSLASASTLCVDQHGRLGCNTTIGAAVASASPGDTILVLPGTYKEDVVISKSLSLVAFPSRNSAIIDATGLSNGIFIDGMSAAPGTGVANVVVSGFTIQNANFEGILVANGYDVTLTGNLVVDNDKALNISAGECPGQPTFETNEGDDCGEGIHLMGTAASSVVNNQVENNSGGILSSDETGPDHDNLISGNVVRNNPFDCGITMASHAPATSVIPSASVSYGVFHNTVAHNVSQHNGYQLPGAGAGVGIFAPGPGSRASENVVIDNKLLDNGQAGVAMHNHAFFPQAPPVDFNNNVIVGNYFSGNAAESNDAATSGPTGINVYSVAPITGTVISQNVFANEAIDVAFKAPSGEIGVHFNNFNARAVGIENRGSGTVSATENWWNCVSGPGTRGCATATGPTVSTLPWLISPFRANSR